MSSSPTLCARRGIGSPPARSRRFCGASAQPPGRREDQGGQAASRPRRPVSHISERVSTALETGEPAISVDTKKKELIGEFKNGGRELRPKGEPTAVLTHDFPSDALGKAIPYGILDIAANQGFVNVGITNETAQFSVASIRAWWEQLGRARYPDAKTLTITADCGGSNGNRARLWKTELQALADQTGLAISVCHFPPGTSKWNRSSIASGASSATTGAASR